jgi:hypothetical protein
MSFGKNPHVAKAEAAEQKARDARDEIAREQAWLEAARRWDRAAERETDDKRRQLYLDKGEHARTQATQPADAGTAEANDTIAGPAKPMPLKAKKSFLN